MKSMLGAYMLLLGVLQTVVVAYFLMGLSDGTIAMSRAGSTLCGVTMLIVAGLCGAGLMHIAKSK